MGKLETPAKVKNLILSAEQAIKLLEFQLKSIYTIAPPTGFEMTLPYCVIVEAVRIIMFPLSMPIPM